ncbi:MAG: GntR family transcriptional regulator [Bryobacterales bacterium]|nr:GntR family transcriptional regulator [Bryobacterales bacterium]
MRQPVQFTLNQRSGVPAYRQIIDQVLGGIAAGTLRPGDQLPTVRQLAVDLAINPNTVLRAYRELEIREVLTTQQGTGTFLTDKKPAADGLERRRRIGQIAGEMLARAGAEGIDLAEILNYLNELLQESTHKEPGRRT